MYYQLEPGKIILDYGPILMTIEASRKGFPLSKAAIKGAKMAMEELNALSQVQWRAKMAASGTASDDSDPDVLKLMIQASKATEEPDITPMAAVAGAFAEKTLNKTRKFGAKKIIVNNGGDIAVCLEHNSSIRVGIISNLSDRQITHYIEIKDNEHIGGIATSGFGGRSFTKGIASALVVLAESASLADACATMVANAVFADHPTIRQTPAEQIDPLTDIKGQMVTESVGKLDPKTIQTAIALGKEKFFQYRERGLLQGVVIAVQGQIWMYPGGIAKRV